MYYLQSRYYDPTTCRFINADAYASTGQGILGNNMFAYCGNNSISRVDIGGDFWDTIFDVASLFFSVVDVVSNPSDPWAWAGLAGDVVDVLIPCVGGIGEAAKAAGKVDDVIDGICDTSRVIDNTGEIIDTAGDVARKTDFYVSPSGDVIPANRADFDYNLSQMELKDNGKYYGVDTNNEPVRVRIEQHNETPGYTGPPNPYHTSSHFHVDRKVKGKTGDYRKVATMLLEDLY